MASIQISSFPADLRHKMCDNSDNLTKKATSRPPSRIMTTALFSIFIPGHLEIGCYPSHVLHKFGSNSLWNSDLSPGAAQSYHNTGLPHACSRRANSSSSFTSVRATTGPQWLVSNSWSWEAPKVLHWTCFQNGVTPWHPVHRGCSTSAPHFQPLWLDSALASWVQLVSCTVVCQKVCCSLWLPPKKDVPELWIRSPVLWFSEPLSIGLMGSRPLPRSFSCSYFWCWFVLFFTSRYLLTVPCARTMCSEPQWTSKVRPKMLPQQCLGSRQQAGKTFITQNLIHGCFSWHVNNCKHIDKLKQGYGQVIYHCTTCVGGVWDDMSSEMYLTRWCASRHHSPSHVALCLLKHCDVS